MVTVQRYRKPDGTELSEEEEQLERLHEKLHEQAVHIAEVAEQRWLDERVPLHKPKDLVKDLTK